ncbi:MAG TPA: hypothetical protein VF962_00165, partial [Gemmatimonadaceae bacterium]
MASVNSHRAAEGGRMHRRQLFRNGRGDELIYAHAIGLSEALDFCFNRERQPKQMSTLRILSHLIPAKQPLASALRCQTVAESPYLSASAPSDR